MDDTEKSLTDVSDGVTELTEKLSLRGEYPFFAMMDRMQYINRWGLMRNNKTENIKEHSMDVAMVSHALALLRNMRDSQKGVNPFVVVGLAMFHDATEIITGDLPTPIKYKNSEITRSFKEIESQAADTLLTLLPESLRDSYEPLLLPDMENEEIRDAVLLIKAADKICAYIKCIVEESSGNREFSVAKETLAEAVRKMELPEADIFMQYFIPSYGQTLDQISRS